MTFNGTTITPSRILSIAETRAPHEVAAILKIDEEEVLEVLHRAGKIKTQWIVRCNKSGRTYKARSERAGYRLAHLMGLTDWDMHQTDVAPARRKIPIGPERDAAVVQMRLGGTSIKAIAAAVGAGPETIKKDLARLGLATQ